MARITVCLTHFNRAEKLRPTLVSLSEQTVLPDELLVWDDCSPVDPGPVVKEFEHRFPKLIYNRNPQNLGMPGNLNAVLSRATGDYIANLHDADTFDTKLLEKWAGALTSAPSVGMVFCGLSSFDHQAQVTRNTILDLPPISNGREFFRDRLVGHLACPIWGTAMVRKEVHQRLLPFDPRFKNWADVDYWMRVCHNYDIAYIAEPLIKLDNTETPERTFSWYRVFVMNETYMTNIRRHFEHDSRGLAKALHRQSLFLRKRFFRMMLRIIRQGDMNAFRQGISFLPAIYSSTVYRTPAALTDRAKPHRR